MLLSILDEYIPEGILSKIVIMENNNPERKDYKTDLVENNNENNLHYTIRAAGINESRILSGYIYIKNNKSKQNLYLKLIFIIYNLSDNNAIKNHNNNARLVISYNLYNDRKSLNK